uniref:Uncharacterized protein n=1 Tax=Haptolina ericina TaxID=156174 RepID=A0A7S3AT75_9EUKA
MGDIVSALDTAAGGGALSSISSADVVNTMYMVLGGVFGPKSLCSSASCKAFTGDIMGIVNAAGTDVHDLDTLVLTQVAETKWCPDEAGVVGFALTQTFTLEYASVETFTEAKQEDFKQALVREINAGVSKGARLSTSAISLKITLASINVEVTIRTAQPALHDAAKSKMGAMASLTPTKLTTMLGVPVSKSPTEPVQSTIAASGGDGSGNGSGGSSNTGMIIGAVCGGVGLVVLLALVAALIAKNKKAPRAQTNAGSVVQVVSNKPMMENHDDFQLKGNAHNGAV